MKRVFLSVLAMVLVLFVAVSALASNEIQIQGISIENQMIRLAVKTNSSDYLQPSAFSLQMDNTTLAPMALHSFEESGLTSSYIFVIDVSALSQSAKDRIVDMKNTVKAMIDDLPANSNAAVITTDDVGAKIELITGRNELKAKVARIAYNKDKNELGTVIRQVCDFVSADNSVGVRPVIVILSNGENAQASGTFLGELGDQVAQTNATVYTVSFKRYNADNIAINNFGILARKSVGGAALTTEYIEKNKEMTDAEVLELAMEVKKNEKLFCVLDIPVTDLPGVPREITVTMNSGSKAFSDSITLSLAQSKAIEEAISRGTTPEPSPTPEPPGPGPNVLIKWISENPIIAGGIALIVVLVIVLIVLLIVKSRKKPESPVISEEDDRDNKTTPVDVNPPILGSAVEVQLRSVSYGIDVTPNVTITENEDAYIGKQREVCKIVITANDRKLIESISRVHAKLFYKGNMLMIEDNSSSNGTKVRDNEIKGRGPVVLQQNDTIMLANVSFKISWQKR